MKTSLILACAGKGERAGFNKNKLLLTKNGKTYIELALNKFIESGLINEYIVTVSKEDFNAVKNILPNFVKIVVGDKTRTGSIKNALADLSLDRIRRLGLQTRHLTRPQRHRAHPFSHPYQLTVKAVPRYARPLS